ncbi:MAG: hypothetical protein OEY97_11510 [Nitrospirota bacterium]|nr:hypothetical protein [Nitrospirota bacterium]
MRQLTCIRPLALSGTHPRVTGALHPPVPVGRPGAGSELVVLVVPATFDEGTLPPGWRVLERLRRDGLFAGFRADMADLRPFAPGADTGLIDYSWIPIPMGW